MPRYDVECEACGINEIFQHMHDEPASKCPRCGGEARRLISTPMITVRGSTSSDDDLTREYYGVNKNVKVHESCMTGEVLKFDANESESKVREKIRQHYIKAGVKEAEDPGKTKLIK